MPIPKYENYDAVVSSIKELPPKHTEILHIYTLKDMKHAPSLPVYHHQSMIQNPKCLFKQVPISCVVLDDDLPTDLHKEKQSWTEIPINNFISCASSSLVLYSFYSYSFRSWWSSLILNGRKLWLMRRNPLRKIKIGNLCIMPSLRSLTSMCTQVAQWAHPFRL